MTQNNNPYLLFVIQQNYSYTSNVLSNIEKSLDV